MPREPRQLPRRQRDQPGPLHGELGRPSQGTIHGPPAAAPLRRTRSPQLSIRCTALSVAAAFQLTTAVCVNYVWSLRCLCSTGLGVTSRRRWGFQFSVGLCGSHWLIWADTAAGHRRPQLQPVVFVGNYSSGSRVPRPVSRRSIARRAR
jgi:hypothetical protein